MVPKHQAVGILKPFEASKFCSCPKGTKGMSFSDKSDSDSAWWIQLEKPTTGKCGAKMWVSQNWGAPKNPQNPSFPYFRVTKSDFFWMIWGFPHFKKHPMEHATRKMLLSCDGLIWFCTNLDEYIYRTKTSGTFDRCVFLPYISVEVRFSNASYGQTFWSCLHEVLILKTGDEFMWIPLKFQENLSSSSHGFASQCFASVESSSLLTLGDNVHPLEDGQYMKQAMAKTLLKLHHPFLKVKL